MLLQPSDLNRTAVCTGLLVVDSTSRRLVDFAAYRAVTPSFVTYCDCRLPECSVSARLMSWWHNSLSLCIMRYMQRGQRTYRYFATVFSRISVPRLRVALRPRRSQAVMRCSADQYAATHVHDDELKRALLLANSICLRKQHHVCLDSSCHVLINRKCV